MCAELDRLFEPRALAARAWEMRAETPLAGWTRLAALDGLAAQAGADRGVDRTAGTDRMVHIDVALRESEDGAALLEGEIALTVRCICQRCLEVMELDLQARPKLVFRRADELGAAASAAGFEAFEPEPGATLRQVLEDEVLLAMPGFPAHERLEDCGALAAKLAELEPARGGHKSSSPFEVLADLKRKD
jgi:uncharacterized protein